MLAFWNFLDRQALHWLDELRGQDRPQDLDGFRGGPEIISLVPARSFVNKLVADFILIGYKWLAASTVMNLWHALWNLSFTGPDAIDIFGIAFGIFFLQVAVKYLTKLPILGADQPDPTEQREAHFDCLRLGIDLSFLGLVSGIGVLQVAISKLQGEPHTAVEHFELTFILVQFLLVLIATIFTAIFRSPQTQFKRGTRIPAIPGLCAIYCAIAFYKLVAQWL